MSTITALYAIGSVLAVSFISLIGVLTLSIGTHRLKRILFLLVSFSAGALLGDTFFHLLPEVVDEAGSFTATISFWLLGGIAFSFLVEKVIHWHHCHYGVNNEKHSHPFAIMNLFGDMVHNLIDGVIIGASYLVSIPVGVATTIAVVFHEIPQEISDFGVLLHGGFSKKRALLFNFLSALTSIIGLAFAFFLHSYVEHVETFLVPFSAGAFIYIAAADLIPELHKDTGAKKSAGQLAMFLLGIGIMYLLLFVE
jgi:zinc and cadmium transporter